MKPAHCLARLEQLKTVFTAAGTNEKLELLEQLRTRPLALASHTRRLHDILCFVHAYPDSPEIYSLVRDMLAGFGRRLDLKRHRKSLVNSGIAGTTIEYRFFWPMARWLAKHWPDELMLNWQQIDRDQQEKLLKILPLLVPPVEASAFDEVDMSAKSWVNRLKSKAESDAVFFQMRMQHLYSNDLEREQLHDDLDLAYRLLPGKTTPTIANTLLVDSPITMQNQPFRREHAEIRKVISKIRFKVTELDPAAGERIIDLARKTMVTHERDLDAFAYGNRNDVSLVDFGDGYQIACIGIVPERRYLLHASYGLLTCKNGMPVAYFPVSTIFSCAEAAFNLFGAFRGAESALVYSRNIAVVHRLLDVNTFVVDPYQLGYNNRDGLRSGVWWFYYKLGFRPRNEEIVSLLEQELGKLSANPGYRTDLGTLNRLAADALYLQIKPVPAQTTMLSRLGGISTALSSYMATRFGSRREKGSQICAREAMTRLGLSDDQLTGTGQRRSYESWAPLILNLDNLAHWTDSEKRKLAEIIRLKDAPRQINYLKKVNSHLRFRKAVLVFTGKTG